MAAASGGSTAIPPSCQSSPTAPKLAEPISALKAISYTSECAGINVAQHEIGFARRAHRCDAGELPIQADRADETGRGNLVVVDVVDHHPAVVGIAHDHVGHARPAAEITERQHLPIEPDHAHEALPVT